MGLQHSIHLVPMDEGETIGRWIASLPLRKERRDHTVAHGNICDVFTEFDDFSTRVNEWDPRPFQVRQFSIYHPKIIFIIDTRRANTQQNLPSPRTGNCASDRLRQSSWVVDHIGKRLQNVFLSP